MPLGCNVELNQRFELCSGLQGPWNRGSWRAEGTPIIFSKLLYCLLKKKDKVYTKNEMLLNIMATLLDMAVTCRWHGGERVTCNIIITFCIIKIIYLNLPQIVLFLESVFRRRTSQWMTSVLKTKTRDKYNHLSLNWWPLRPSGISICLYWDCSTHNPSIEQLFCNTSNLPACLKRGYNIEQMPPNMSEKTALQPKFGEQMTRGREPMEGVPVCSKWKVHPEERHIFQYSSC